MKRRNQIATGLLVVTLLLFVVYHNCVPQPGAVVVATAAGTGFVPLPVENPALRTDMLEQPKTFQHSGPRRNIFSTAPLSAPEKVQPAPTPVAVMPPPQPAGPPPLAVPATVSGYATHRQSGQRRAFFSQGVDVYVPGLGDVLMSRFHLVQIDNATAELEELASRRRTTVTMERPAL